MPRRPARNYEAPISRFTLLPQEIQNLIWQTAIDCVKPRIVDVRETTARKTRESSYLQKLQFTSPCPIPGVLHACRASRQLALRRWKLSFAARYQDPKIFFDCASDTLFFDGVFADMTTFVDRVDRADRDTVQNLAISALLEFQRYFYNGSTLGISLRDDFPAVSLLIFPWAEGESSGPTELQSAQVRLREKFDPKRGIVMWRKPDLQKDWEFELDIVGEVRECCEMKGWSHPVMELVDSYYTDLFELEYDEDDRNYQRWHVEKLFREYGI